MKMILYIPLIFSAHLALAVRAEIAGFEKLPGDERSKILQNSRSEVKEQLSEIDRLLRLQQKYGGEEAWRRREKFRRLMDLGLAPLHHLFAAQAKLVSLHVGQSLQQGENAGMSKAELIEMEKALTPEAEAIHRHLEEVVVPLVVNLAASPEALALAKKAETLLKPWEKRFNLTEGTSKGPTRKELDAMERAARPILERIKKLPQATPEQIQADIAALPKEHPSR